MNKENQNTEYKRIWNDDYLKWVCGFANAQDGKTYIGISDDISDVGVTHMHQLSYKGTLYAERRNQSENCSDKHCNSS